MSSRRTGRRVGSKSSVTGDNNDPAMPKRTSRRQVSGNVIDDPNRSELHRGNFLSQYSQLIEDKDKNLLLYFVLPEGKTRATCDSNLAIVYTNCEDLQLDAQWITEAECLLVEPKVGNIFVLAPFEGPAFEYLEKCREKLQFEIIGPQCIRYGLSEGKNTAFSIGNEGYSTYTLAMRGLMICMTGVSGKEKQNLRLKIRRMGGHESNEYTHGVTHLIADKLLTPKSEMASKRGIPVMMSEWVHKVWNDSQKEQVHATDEKYCKYSCPIFHRLVICVSQISQQLKLSYKKTIEAHGGIYSAELKKDTSILIVPQKGSEKFKFAQNWKIPCVVPAWVDDSKSAGHLLPFKTYYVDDELRKISTPVHSMVQYPPDQGIGHGAVGMNDSVISCVAGGRQNNTEATYMHDESQIYAGASGLDIDELERAAAKGHYLDGCTIYVSGNLPLDNVKKHIHAAGALHLSAITKCVTHILITEKTMSLSESERVKQLGINPFIVNLKWLVASAKKGSPEDEELFSEHKDVQVISETLVSTKSSSGSSSSRSNNTHSTLSSKRSSGEVGNIQGRKRSNERRSNDNLKERSPRPSILHSTDNDVSSQEKEKKQQHAEVDADLGHNGTDTGDNSGSGQLQDPHENIDENGAKNDHEYSVSEEDSESVYVFTDKKIKLALQDEEESVVANSIRAANGHVVRGADYDYIVLPAVCDPQFFVGEHEAKCVTKYWVFDCIDSSTVISTRNRKFHHKPLKTYANMQEIMAEVVVAITQYSHTEKAFLSTLVTTMGGTYQDVFARRASKKTNTVASTHLICPNTNNDKYRAANKWGTFAVVAEWLTDSFMKKQKMSEVNYNPELTSDSDSQSQNSCIMPQTPKFNDKVSLQPVERHGRFSTMSATPSSAAKGQQDARARSASIAVIEDNDESPFKTPTSLAKRRVDRKAADATKTIPGSELLARDYEDPAFLKFVAQKKAENGDVTPPPQDFETFKAKYGTRSFLEYQAEMRNLRGEPAEEQPSIVMEGMTTEEARMFRIALENAGATTPPPNLKKKKKLPTPTSVMMARSWKQILEKFPVQDIPYTSTPKAAKFNSSANNSASSSNVRGANGVKRSSDSSAEDEIGINGGTKAATKRFRISSESEDTDISEINDDAATDFGVKKIPNHRQLSSEESYQEEPKGPLYNIVVWISEDCDKDEIRGGVIELGGEVVDDMQNPSITHLIVEVETQKVSEAQERIQDLKIVRPSWVTDCKALGQKADEENYKAVPSSKRSALALADMLAMNDSDEFGLQRQKQKKNRNNHCSTGRLEQVADEMNPDEYDAPAVVWDDNHDVSELVPRRENEKSIRNDKKEKRNETAGPSHTSSRSKQQQNSDIETNVKQVGTTSSTKTSATKSSIRSRSRTKEQNGYILPCDARFMFSGVEAAEKRTAENGLKQVGGQVVDSAQFDPSVQAIIIKQLARSEKVLASIAAGKFVLKFSYVHKCVNANQLVPITDEDMWRKGDGTNNIEKEMASAAEYWFQQSRLNPPNTPFKDMKIHLTVASQSKRSAYERLIKAGGGCVIPDIEQATLIINDKTSGSAVDGIEVVSPLYLNQLIFRSP